jgi:hypothetical protein
MARAFRVEDGHPLDSTAEAAVVQIVEGAVRSGLDRLAGSLKVTGRRLKRAAAIMILRLER